MAGGNGEVVEIGTEAEFEAFAAARWTRLVRTAYMLTGDHHEAEDLVQTTLVKVFARWSRIRDRGDPDTYVRRALVNNNISRIRKRRVAHVLMPFLPDRVQLGDTDPLEHRSVLMTALAALPPRQRAAVVLRYWEDMSEEEAAAALDCSVGGVKSQAARGLVKLREHPALADLHPLTGRTRDAARTGNGGGR